MFVRTTLAAILSSGLILGFAGPAAAAGKPASGAKPAATKSASAKAAAETAPTAIAASAVLEAVKRPGGFMVPKPVVLKNPTQAELEANAVWNLRAAMNVAALQCQYSQFLRTTKNYNSFLQAHSEELVRAQTTMIGHFRRTDGAKAVNRFDEYTTRTYNSYSTLDAQYTFCEAAGLVGRHALAVPKSQLGVTALVKGPEIRAALAYLPLAPALAVVMPDAIALPDFAAAS
jgi:hypothetical protein